MKLKKNFFKVDCIMLGRRNLKLMDRFWSKYETKNQQFRALESPKNPFKTLRKFL